MNIYLGEIATWLVLYKVSLYVEKTVYVTLIIENYFDKVPQKMNTHINGKRTKLLRKL